MSEKASSVKASVAVEENDNETDTCVVCFKNVDIYSIGECDHPVCYECSTRMRVLCEQNECPICRHVLSKVIFTYDKLPYRELEAKNRSGLYNKRYQVGFYDAKIQQAFFELLDHPCPKCNIPRFRKFQDLRNHVRKEHDLHYCDLCVEHLKIFTFERRCYTQAELGLHRVKGDADNRSHRGHPLCEYCNKRYLDRDELFRHLRRDHYFCHFCEADGSNDFYEDYDALAEHFRKDHYLCEEGKCATERFVGAFRTEIDYKAHIASVHGKSLNKQQAKQTRTLQLEITLGRPLGRPGQPEQAVSNFRSRRPEEREEPPEPPIPTQHNQRSINIDRSNEEEFPSLAGAAGGPNVSLVCPQFVRLRGGISGLQRTKENFPALGSSGGGGSDTSHRPHHHQQQQPAPPNFVPSYKTLYPSAGGGGGSVSGGGGGGSKKEKENFPALGDSGLRPHLQTAPPISAVLRKAPTASTGAIPRTTTTSLNTNAPSMVIHVSNRTSANNSIASAGKKSTQHDFPSLSAAGGKSKKNNRAALDEDMLPSPSYVPIGNVSAKHRPMIDDYVSVANPSNFHKIQMVQKEEQEAKARKAAEQANAPKLTTEDFPSLGGGGGNNGGKAGAQANSWAKALSDKKQRELENRKAKVAPAPVLPKDSKTSLNAANKQKQVPLAKTTSNTDQQSIKKSNNNKKPKEKKSGEQVNQTNNGNSKNKEKSNNNNNNEEYKQDKVQVQNAMNASMPLLNGNDANSGLRPPPGFHSNVTVNSVAKSPNSLTFTNSLGESYSIVSSHAYVPPTDASTRNQKLVHIFKEALNTPEALEEFRQISQKFREGVYKTEPYYEHCQAALKDKFEIAFPELLALLPDISKQQELYLVHTQYINKLPANTRKQLPKLHVCSTCKQVLLQDDFDLHRQGHAHKENFPALGSGNASGNKNALTNRK